MSSPYPTPPTDSTPRSLRVLVADDEYFVARHTAGMLGDLGYEVVATVPSGRQAVERASQGGVDVAVLDVMMPDVDGIAVAKEIGETHNVASVLLSAFHDPTVVDRAMQCGAGGYVLKPATREQLRASVEVAVGLARCHREARERLAKAEAHFAEYELAQKAKWLVVERYRVSEPDAWFLLQKASRAGRVRLGVLAERVLATGALPDCPSVRATLQTGAPRLSMRSIGTSPRPAAADST